MLPQLPEPDRHPTSPADVRRRVARAAVSPSAIVVTAAGFLIGVAAQSLTIAIILAVVAWLGRMVVAIALARKRGRRLPVVAIDPFAVSEPWRQYVRQAVAARQRFDQAVSRWPAGPLHDRLMLLQPRLGQAVDEVWAVAQQGAALDGTVRGVPTGATRPSIEQLSEELRRIQAERQQTAASDRQNALARSEEAVAAQLRAARRSEAVRAEVLDRLRLRTAQLDEAVTQLLALGLDRPGGDGSVEEVAGSVDALLEEIGALHQGLQEAGAAAAGTDLPTRALPGPGASLPPASSPAGPTAEPPATSTAPPSAATLGNPPAPPAPPGPGLPSSPPTRS